MDQVTRLYLLTPSELTWLQNVLVKPGYVMSYDTCGYLMPYNSCGYVMSYNTCGYLMSYNSLLVT